MPTRTHDQNTLLHGSWNAICDVCGFKYKAVDLKKRWDGLMVCKEDWEPRHPSDFFKGTAEDTAVPWARSDDTGQQLDDTNTDVKGGTFPKTTDPQGTKTAGAKPDPDADGLVEGDFLPSGEVASGTVTKA